MRPQPLPLMLFAAGFGTRMGALTATRPKPLVPVLGRPLINRALDLARTAGAAPVVANTHYLGQMIADHLAGSGVAISAEPGPILETGGGLKQALPLLGVSDGGPVMTLNPDAVWRGPNPLALLQAAWDPTRMDALLLVQDVARVRGRTAGKADFHLDGTGRLAWAGGVAEGMLYLGAQILRSGPIAACPERVFSLHGIWSEMIAAGRAFGLVYDGDWCDVGSPDGLAEAEAMLGEGPG
ncbi:MAG: nucleotidyltransferase family protein [Fuscovulum sp.]|nr:nucleotidyltransferase family protein [Fuscovulum sp.]